MSCTVVFGDRAYKEVFKVKWGHMPEKEMATHSSILAWRIPWTEEPGGLLSIMSHRVGHGWSDLACLHSCLENPRDRGARWAAVYGVSQSWKWLKRLSSSKGYMHGALIQWDWYPYERIYCFLHHVRAQSGKGPSPENNPAGPWSGTPSHHNCEKRNFCCLRHQYFMVFCPMVFGIWCMVFCYGNLSRLTYTLTL